MARLPDSVRKNAEQANQILNGNTEEASPAALEVKEPVLETPEPQTSNPDPQPEPTELAPKEPAPIEDNSPWEHKYSILQGKYNKEIGDLRSEIKALKEANANAGNSGEIERLRGEINRLQQQQAAIPVPVTTTPDVEKLKGEYGEELVNGVAAMIQGMIAPVQKQVETVNQTVTNTNVEASHAQMRALLKASNIDYDQINTDPVFIGEYLQAPDPYSGMKRVDLVNDAFHSGDFERAALFFRSYVESPAPNPSAKPSLENHAQVPSTAPAKPEDTPVENVWNDASVKQFYIDKQKGTKYTPKEAAALETELFAFLAKK